MITRRALVGASAEVTLSSCQGSHEAWHRALLWIGGSGVIQGISGFGFGRQLDISDDLKANRIITRGVSCDGRCLLFQCNELAALTSSSDTVGCIDPASLAVPWTVKDDRRFVQEIRWAPGDPYVWMIVMDPKN